MASAESSTPQKKHQRGLPPMRGQIKVQIFENLIKTVVSMVSKAPRTPGRTDGSGSSASATPPPSVYNSDGNPET